jgi:hypothetical protein
VLGSGWAAIHFLGPKIAARLHKHSGEPVNAAPESGVAPSFAAANSAQADTAPTAAQSTAADPGAIPPSDPAISSSPATGGGAQFTSGTAPALDLKLKAARAADVKVVADGKPLFEGHMDARQVYRFTAVDTLEISSSESSAIVLELNGQAVAAGGQPGQPGVTTLTQKDLKTAGGDPH